MHCIHASYILILHALSNTNHIGNYRHVVAASNVPANFRDFRRCNLAMEKFTNLIQTILRNLLKAICDQFENSEFEIIVTFLEFPDLRQTIKIAVAKIQIRMNKVSLLKVGPEQIKDFKEEFEDQIDWFKQKVVSKLSIPILYGAFNIGVTDFDVNKLSEPLEFNIDVGITTDVINYLMTLMDFIQFMEQIPIPFPEELIKPDKLHGSESVDKELFVEEEQSSSWCLLDGIIIVIVIITIVIVAVFIICYKFVNIKKDTKQENNDIERDRDEIEREQDEIEQKEEEIEQREEGIGNENTQQRLERLETMCEIDISLDPKPRRGYNIAKWFHFNHTLP